MSFELPGIFVAGLLTFLSPCILPLVPLYLSLLGGVSVAELRSGGAAGEQATAQAVKGRLRGRLMLTAVMFSLGLAVVFVALGMAATSLGHAFVAHRELLLQLGGLIVFLFGLKFLGVLRLPFLERESRPWFQRIRASGGLFSAFAFGAAFALGWTPCVGPVLGSVLTFTASSTSSPLEGAAYLGAYALGLAVPLIITAAVAPWALKLLDRMRGQMRRIEVATGVLLLALGLLLMTDSLERLTPSLSSTPIAASPTASESDKAVAAVLDSALPNAANAASAGTPNEAAACPAPGSIADGEPASCAVPESVTSSIEVAGFTDGGGATVAGNVAGPVMLEFVSRSCPVCQRMAPVVAAAEHDCRGRGVTVKRVDVSDSEGARLARQYAIRGLPTFVMVDEGKEVARLVGEQSLASLTQSLEVLAGEKCDAFRTIQ